ncbi:MAG: aminotransferase class III-fold pyridoxal phosphate-dependent enzyme, partial [Gemmatimonadaceae bacterium]
MNQSKDQNNSYSDDDEWRARAEDVIPGGSSTGSKRAAALYGSASHDSRLPTHYERAKGCSLYTTEGSRLIDCSMALGAVAIGYADASVTRAVHDAATNGNVTGLPHRLEVEVAERLVEVIPCAEQVRFLRT